VTHVFAAAAAIVIVAVVLRFVILGVPLVVEPLDKNQQPQRTDRADIVNDGECGFDIVAGLILMVSIFVVAQSAFKVGLGRDKGVPRNQNTDTQQKEYRA